MTSTFNKILTVLFLMSYVLVLISFQSDAYERTKVKNQELSQELQEVKGESKRRRLLIRLGGVPVYRLQHCL